MKTWGAFPAALALILVWVLTCSSRTDDALWLIVPCIAIIAGYAAVLASARHLGQRQIDTVYYLGFLTTLAVLGAAVIRLTRDGASADPSSIRIAAGHFAVGLVATGVGLVARLLLQQRVTSAESVGDALTNYVDVMARLSDRMDEAVVKFERLTEETLQGASETSRRSAEGALKVIADGLAPVTEEIRSSVASVHGSLSRLDSAGLRSLPDSVTALEGSMNALIQTLQQAEGAVCRMRTEVDASTQTHLQHAHSSDAVDASCRALDAGLAALLPSLAAIDTALRSYEAALGQAATLQGRYVKSTGQAVAELQSNTVGLTGLVLDMARKMAELSQATAGMDPQALTNLGASLAVAVEQLNRLGADVGRFAHTIRSSHAAVSETPLQELTVDFKRQGDLVKQAASDLGQAMVRLSTELGAAIHEGLSH
jgi:hypothetical protein